MADFDPVKHPRNTRGEFAHTLGELAKGAKVHLPGGIHVEKHSSDRFTVRAPGYEVTNKEHPSAAADHALTLSARSTHPDSLGGARSHKDLPSALKSNRARARRGAGKPKDVPNPTRLPSRSGPTSPDASVSRRGVERGGTSRKVSDLSDSQLKALASSKHGTTRAAAHNELQRRQRGDGEPTTAVPLRDKVAAAKKREGRLASRSADADHVRVPPGETPARVGNERDLRPGERIQISRNKQAIFVGRSSDGKRIEIRRIHPDGTPAKKTSWYNVYSHEPVVPEADRAAAKAALRERDVHMPDVRARLAETHHPNHAKATPAEIKRGPTPLNSLLMAEHAKHSVGGENYAASQAKHYDRLAALAPDKASRNHWQAEAERHRQVAAVPREHLQPWEDRRQQLLAEVNKANHAHVEGKGGPNEGKLLAARDVARQNYDAHANSLPGAQAEPPASKDSPSQRAKALRNRVEREKIHLTDHEHRALAHMQEKNKSKVTLMSMRGDKEHTLEGLTQKIDKESANPSANTLKLRGALSGRKSPEHVTPEEAMPRASSPADHERGKPNMDAMAKQRAAREGGSNETPSYVPPDRVAHHPADASGDREMVKNENRISMGGLGKGSHFKSRGKTWTVTKTNLHRKKDPKTKNQAGLSGTLTAVDRQGNERIFGHSEIPTHYDREKKGGGAQPTAAGRKADEVVGPSGVLSHVPNETLNERHARLQSALKHAPDHAKPQVEGELAHTSKALSQPAAAKSTDFPGGFKHRVDIPDGTTVEHTDPVPVTVKVPVHAMIKDRSGRAGKFVPKGSPILTAGSQHHVRGVRYTDAKGKQHAYYEVGKSPDFEKNVRTTPLQPDAAKKHLEGVPPLPGSQPTAAAAKSTATQSSRGEVAKVRVSSGTGAKKVHVGDEHAGFVTKQGSRYIARRPDKSKISSGHVSIQEAAKALVKHHRGQSARG